MVTHEHIDLRPYTEVFQINPRLNREARPRHNAPLIMRFEIVHVRAIAVHLLPDGVSRAMRKKVAVTLGHNVASRRVIHFKPAYQLSRSHGSLHALYRPVPRVTHNGEDLAHVV